MNSVAKRQAWAFGGILRGLARWLLLMFLIVHVFFGVCVYSSPFSIVQVCMIVHSFLNSRGFSGQSSFPL